MEIKGMQKPDVKKTYLGKQPKFEPYGLSTLSHHDPEIVLDDNELEIKIKSSQPTKVTANLINMATEKPCEDCIFHQTDENDVISFNISIPEPGFYKFQIYASPASEDSKTLYGVYNYLLMCRSANKPCRRYPKQYASWKGGCLLKEPLYIGDCNLSDVNFHVKVPGAQDVALTLDGKWVHLTQSVPAVWEGSIAVKDYKDKNIKLSLHANFGGDKSKYSTLLHYVL